MPIDYSKGKVYKIISDSTDKIYIGSTCQSLANRLYEHKRDKHRITSKEIVKFPDCQIILLEDVPCERKEQLTSRERYHIDENKAICVNKTIPTRTVEEWRIETNYDRKSKDKAYQTKHREKILEKARAKRDILKDELNAKNRVKIRCDCGLEINKSSFWKHIKRSIHQARLAA